MDTPPPRGRPWVLVALRVFLWILGSLAGMVGLVLVGLWLWFPDEKIRGLVVAELEKRLQAKIEIQGLEVHLLRGIHLRGVRLEPAAGFSLAPLEVKGFWLEYSLSDLWNKRLVVKKILLEQPQIQLELNGLGSNLPRLAPAEPGTGAPPPEKPFSPQDIEYLVDLQSVEIKDARFVLNLEGVQVEIDGFDLGLSGRLGSPASTRLEVSGGFSSPRSRISLSIPQGQVAWPIRTRPQFSFRLSLAQWSQQALAGKLELVELMLSAHGNPHRLSMEWSAESDLVGQRVTLRGLKLGWDGAPWVELSGKVEQVFGPWRVEGELKRLGLPATLVQEIASRFAPALRYQGEVWLRDVGFQMARGQAWPKAAGELLLEGVSLALGKLAVAPTQGALRWSLAGRGALDMRASGHFRSGRISAGGLVLSRPALELEAEAALEPSGQGFLLDHPRLKLTASMGALQGPFGALTGLRLSARAASEKEPIRLTPEGVRVAHLASRGEAEIGAFERSPLSIRKTKLSWDLLGSRLVAGAGRILRLGGLKGQLALGAEEILAGPVRVEKASLAARAQGQGLALPGKFAHPLSLALSLGTAGVWAPPVELTGVSVELASQLGALPPEALPVELKTTVRGPRVAKILAGEDLVLPGDLEAALKGSWDQPRQKIAVETLSIEQKGLVGLQASGDFALPTRRGALKIKTGPVILEKVLALLPARLCAGWPALTGSVELSAETRVALPEGPLNLQTLELPLELSLRWNGIGLALAAPELSVRELSGLLELQSRGTLGKELRLQTSFSLGQARLAAQDLTVTGLKGSVEAERAGLTLDARTKVELDELAAPRFLEKPLQAVALDVSGRGVEQKEWHVDRFLLQLGSLGLGVNASGRLVFPPDSREWAQLRVSSRLGVDLATPSALPLPAGITLSGGAHLSVSVDTRADGMIQTLGRMEFDNLDLSGPGFGLSRMKGSIPVTQRIALGAVGGQGGSDFLYGQPREREGWAVYEDALRPMMGKNRAFAIQHARFRDLELSSIAGSLNLSEGHLNVGNLQFVFLRGDILANADLVLSPATHRRFSLDAEMSGVDISKLAALSFAESSEVSGNLHLGLDMHEKSFAATVNLTQIGRSTLQALLVALDPGKTNPGVQALRNYLDDYDVSPRRVSLQILHGLLGMDVVMDMGLAARTAARLIAGFDGDTFRLKHLPVAGLLAKYLGF